MAGRVPHRVFADVLRCSADDRACRSKLGGQIGHRTDHTTGGRNFGAPYPWLRPGRTLEPVLLLGLSHPSCRTATRRPLAGSQPRCLLTSTAPCSTTNCSETAHRSCSCTAGSASITPTSGPGSTLSPKTSPSSSTTTGATGARSARPISTTCSTPRGPTTQMRSDNT